MTVYDELFIAQGGTITLDPTPEEVHASLRFLHDELDPDEITELLQITPDVSHRKGDPNIGENGRVYSPYRTGVWTFSSKDKINTTDANAHIHWVLDNFSEKVSAIHELQSRGYSTEIICAWFAKCDNTCPLLSIEMIRLLAKFGLDIWFDVYMFPAED